MAFLDQLGVASRATEMSFGFHCRETGFTYAGNNLNGVMSPSVRCVECGRSRATMGRKKTAAGWRCAGCHQAREYRKAIKGAA